MQVRVNTDNHIEGGEGLTQHVQSVVEDALARFGDRITRVEVQLADENSSKKSGENDKRCTMEARLAGLQPVAVTSLADTLNRAIDGAVGKLERTLDRTLEKRNGRKGRSPQSGE